MKRMIGEETGAPTSVPEVPASAMQISETLNRTGATALARRLEDFWHHRGYPTARFWAEPISERFQKIGTHELYSVACNLINGLPPVYRSTEQVHAGDGRRLIRA
jgi:hypothetical protein